MKVCDLLQIGNIIKELRKEKNGHRNNLQKQAK